MSKTAVVTARVSEETLATLDKLSARLDRSRAWIVTRAIERYVEDESEFPAFLQVGRDDVDAGRVLTQEEVEARFHAKREARNAA